MIEKLFDSFLINHFTNADRFDGLIMWILCTAFVWYWMVKLRGIALKGGEGENGFWESHEQIIYWTMKMVPPIVFKAAFVSDVPIYVWYFMAGIILFALFGRGVLDYLPFLRQPVKKDEPVKVTTETTTETTIKNP
jgi:hypothetical protein